jgi:hypothetical protein
MLRSGTSNVPIVGNRDALLTLTSVNRLWGYFRGEDLT